MIRQVLSQQAVGVFVRSSLPGVVRVTEVNFHVRGHSEGFVFSQLAGLVAVDAVHSDAHHARLGCDGDLPSMPSPS